MPSANLSQPTPQHLGEAVLRGITFERKESGCLRDCREEEKEERKGRGRREERKYH